MSREYYSARLLYIILVDDGRPKKKNHFEESIIVFKAGSREEAFDVALTLGKKRESSYLNDRKQRVRWALVDIVNLDWVGKKIDGSEVASHLHHRINRRAISAKKQFHPEKSKACERF